MMVNQMTRKVKKVVEVEPREVYGNLLYYPANKLARTFKKLIPTKTFSSHDLKVIKSLGFELKMVVSPLADLITSDTPS